MVNSKTCLCGKTWEDKDWIYIGDQDFDDGIVLAMFNFPCENPKCKSTFSIRKAKV